jgi:glycerol-3-phosphate acyltransferase PlsY
MNVYNLIDLGGAMLVLVVMTLTEHDVINTNAQAPVWLQWTRRISLGSLVLLLCNAIVEDNSQMSLLLLVWFGLISMAVNAIAIIWRRPTNEHGKTYATQASKRRPY